MKHIAWLVVALVGCTDFASIDRGVCGNGLLEEGEDCDSSAATCISCAITCSETSPCPEAYSCGVDGVCHAPGGVLGQATSAGAFQADELRITDIDHDAIGDAFGLTRTSVVVRYGDEAGQLDQLQSVVTPTQTGPAAFGDTDKDGVLDIVITTLDGMVSYSSQFAELAPVAVLERVTGEMNERLDMRQLFYVTSNVFTALIVDPDSGAVVLVNADPTAGPVLSDAFKYVLPCSARIGAIPGSQIDSARIDMYNVSRRQDAVIDAVFAISVGSGIERKFCVLSIHRGAPNLLTGKAPPFEFADITPALGTAPTPMKDPVLADMDFDSDGCPGVVHSDPGINALQYWDGEMVGGKCTIKAAGVGNPATLPPMGAPLSAAVIGRAPVEPRVLTIAADALVTNEGVYVFGDILGFKYVTAVYRTMRTITQYGHGDLNGDGAVDIAFAAGGEEDIDVLYRVGNEAGFNLYRIDTATAVSKMTLGDYDGNFLEDIAYTEVLDDYERLLVSFGTPDRPTEPVRVGVFDAVLGLDRISIADSIDTLALSEDLVVFQPPAMGTIERRATVLHGSPQRTLLSYFDPRNDTEKEETVFRGAVVGHFKAGAGTEQFTDLLAVAPARKRANDTVSEVVKAWLVPGTTDGLDGATSPGTGVSGIADCSLVGNTDKLCLDIARYTAFPVGTDRDVVIGIDRDKRTVMLDPWAASVAGTKLDTLSQLMPDDALPTSLQVVDLDGDGAKELLATLKPAPGMSTGAVITCAMQNGVPQSCTDVAPAIQSAATAAGIPVDYCYAAAAGKMSHRARSSEADLSSDLVVACRGEGTTIFRVRNTSGSPEVTRLANVSGIVSGIQVGDVTGDGVDDLLVLEGDVSRSLLIYPQCTNRDLTCIKGGK